MNKCKTFVINMEKDKQRLSDFDDMMKESKWQYERIEAINGNALDSYATKLKSKYIADYNHLSNNEIGCMLSHIKLFEKLMADEVYDQYIIFEDDARTHMNGNDVKKSISDLFKNIKNTPDILYLGKALDYCMEYKKVWKNVYKPKRPLCNHAYLISKNGAAKILNKKPFKLAIDNEIANLIYNEKINALAYHPSIYFQDVLSYSSNLRNLSAALNNNTECIMNMHYMSIDTVEYVIYICIALIVALILFYVAIRNK